MPTLELDGPFVCLIKASGERFLICWDRDPRSRREVSQMLIDMACDDELDFTADDAARMNRQALRLDDV